MINRKQYEEYLRRRQQEHLAGIRQSQDIFWRTLLRAIADYMQSEGCSCCQNREKHEEAKAKIAKLLRVPKWKDGSGYNFDKFATNPTELEY